MIVEARGPHRRCDPPLLPPRRRPRARLPASAQRRATRTRQDDRPHHTGAGALTIVADEDIDAIRDGAWAVERRAIRVRRLTREAYAQDALLSQRDISVLTGYSDSAVSLTAVALRNHGEFLPLRGYLADMGSLPTHKAAIIRLYLQGVLTPGIARRSWHSKQAVDRYIRGFKRVRLLAGKTRARYCHCWQARPPVPSTSTSPSSTNTSSAPRRRRAMRPFPRNCRPIGSATRRQSGAPRRHGAVRTERGGLPQRRRTDTRRPGGKGRRRKAAPIKPPAPKATAQLSLFLTAVHGQSDGPLTKCE